MAAIGTIIDDKYEILAQVGKGGMSTVYLARDKRLNKQWAVKEIIKNARDKNNEIVIQSAIAEANLIKQLDHPSLPRIVDIIDNPTVIYVIMDYIEGEPLSKVLEEFGAQAQDLVIEWAKTLCEVLDFLHTRKSPIIYRDMKPSNIMLKPDGNLKLIDFGIAREYKEQNLADTVSLGTKGYAAPEQFGGKGQTDPRTDVYCLGVTLYHLITGQNPCEPPYELYPIRHYNPQLSGGLERIIQKCTMLNPDDRYQSCAELLYAIEHYEEIDDIYRKRQKNKLVAFLASAIITFLVGIASALFFFASTQTKTSDYNHLIDLATQTSFIEAISINNSDKTAYLGLAKIFKNDAVLTSQEANIIRTLENSKSFEALKVNSENYAEVCYQMGTAFWFYCIEDQSIHAEATKWFSNVSNIDKSLISPERQKDHKMAQIYQKMGEFYANEITWNKEGGAPADAYSNYWSNINQLLVDDDGENQFVSVKIMNELVREAVLRQKILNSNGIDNAQIIKAIKDVQTKLNEIEPSTIEVQEQKQSLLDLCAAQLKQLS